MQAKVTILIIEDEKNICDFIATTLKAQGYKAITTALGRDGISLTASQCPELILLDLGLPDIDGMEVIRQVRSYSHYSHICQNPGKGKSDGPGFGSG